MQHLRGITAAIVTSSDILTVHNTRSRIINMKTMAVPLYTLQLKQRLLPGRVTIGKYDGSHCCITAATTGDKVG